MTMTLRHRMTMYHVQCSRNQLFKGRNFESRARNNFYTRNTQLSSRHYVSDVVQWLSGPIYQSYIDAYCQWALGASCCPSSPSTSLHLWSNASDTIPRPSANSNRYYTPPGTRRHSIAPLLRETGNRVAQPGSISTRRTPLHYPCKRRSRDAILRLRRGLQPYGSHLPSQQ